MGLWLWLLPACLAVAALIHMAIATRPLHRGRVVEIWIVHLLFWATGLGSLLAFYAFVFSPLSAQIAQDFTWEAGNPFQSLAGIALLPLGVLGVLSVWLRGSFWVATVVMAVVMSWTEVGTVWLNEASDYQIGLSIWWDGIGSGVLLALLILYRARAGYHRFWKA